jgi:protein gp37
VADNTRIEWAHSTFNPWRGCTKVSAGCDHCYAEKGSKRNPSVLGTWGPDGTRVVAAEKYWQAPERWNAEAVAAGVRRRVFCASLADVFEDREELHAPRLHLFDLIRRTPALDWLLLTKRPENILPALHRASALLGAEARAAPLSYRGDLDGWIIRWVGGAPPHNVWLGTSVEDQDAADTRIPHLLRTPAAVRFLSCEPLLGPVDLTAWMPPGRCNWQCSGCRRFFSGSPYPSHCPSCGLEGYLSGSHVGNGKPNGQPLDWVIVGGESGPHARPMHPDWARSLREQCVAAGTAFFFKQAGRVLAQEWGCQDGKGADFTFVPEDLRIRQSPENAHAYFGERSDA